MARFTAILALTVSLAPLALAEDPFVQLYIDRPCNYLGSDYEYILYTNPHKTTNCLTIGGPGYPFFSTDEVTQCGDYTNGGAQSGACNSAAKNALAVSGGGGNLNCGFWTSDDCGAASGADPWMYETFKADGDAACLNLEPDMPTGDDKHSASSMFCTLA